MTSTRRRARPNACSADRSAKLPPIAITLLDIYTALGEPALFAIGQSQDHPECLVEQAVNGALEGTLSQARDLISARFAAVTLGDLSRDFDDRFAAGRGL